MIIADNDNAHAVEDSQENFWAHDVVQKLNNEHASSISG